MPFAHRILCPHSYYEESRVYCKQQQQQLYFKAQSSNLKFGHSMPPMLIPNFQGDMLWLYNYTAY